LRHGGVLPARPNRRNNRRRPAVDRAKETGMADIRKRTEDRPTEDDIQREKLGPRGVPGEPDPAKMTPQREKKTPKHIDPGQTA
jgi:hypothetical protein